MGVTALFVLAYVLFAEKNLDFEYLVLTEHLSRVLYMFFVAALLLYWGNHETFPQVLLGLLAVANILTKTSGIVLIPTFLVWRLMDPKLSDGQELPRQGVGAAATVLMCLNLRSRRIWRFDSFLSLR
jgi:hypothetical protein